eukprot:scaffold10021_cov147-Isochrysis_galbana.AAC.2
MPRGGASRQDVPFASAMKTMSWSAVCSSTQAPLANSAETCAHRVAARAAAAAAASEHSPSPPAAIFPPAPAGSHSPVAAGAARASSRPLDAAGDRHPRWLTLSTHPLLV